MIISFVSWSHFIFTAKHIIHEEYLYVLQFDKKSLEKNLKLTGNFPTKDHNLNFKKVAKMPYLLWHLVPFKMWQSRLCHHNSFIFVATRWWTRKQSFRRWIYWGHGNIHDCLNNADYALKALIHYCRIVF